MFNVHLKRCLPYRGVRHREVQKIPPYNHVIILASLFSFYKGLVSQIIPFLKIPITSDFKIIRPVSESCLQRVFVLKFEKVECISLQAWPQWKGLCTHSYVHVTLFESGLRLINYCYINKL